MVGLASEDGDAQIGRAADRRTRPDLISACPADADRLVVGDELSRMTEATRCPYPARPLVGPVAGVEAFQPEPTAAVLRIGAASYGMRWSWELSTTRVRWGMAESASALTGSD